MNFGERVKEIRKYYHLTQVEFASKLGISGSAINMMEKGKIEASNSTKTAICNVFAVNPLYLSGESDLMIVPPDEDEEIIDRAMKKGDPVLKALLMGLVKQPGGWDALADVILSAADYLRAHGYDVDSITKKDEPSE